jgi:hypothetical protein
VFEFWRAIARPWQTEVITTEVIAGFFIFTAFGLEGLEKPVEFARTIQKAVLSVHVQMGNGLWGG